MALCPSIQTSWHRLYVRNPECGGSGGILELYFAETRCLEIEQKFFKRRGMGCTSGNGDRTLHSAVSVSGLLGHVRGFTFWPATARALLPDAVCSVSDDEGPFP